MKTENICFKRMAMLGRKHCFTDNFVCMHWIYFSSEQNSMTERPFCTTPIPDKCHDEGLLVTVPKIPTCLNHPEPFSLSTMRWLPANPNCLKRLLYLILFLTSFDCRTPSCVHFMTTNYTLNILKHFMATMVTVAVRLLRPFSVSYNSVLVLDMEWLHMELSQIGFLCACSALIQISIYLFSLIWRTTISWSWLLHVHTHNSITKLLGELTWFIFFYQKSQLWFYMV